MTEIPEPPARRSFAEVTAVRATGPGRYVADLDPHWTIGGKPNGGYLLAVLGRAALETGHGIDPGLQVLAATGQYPHSPDPGPVELIAEVQRAGRSFSYVRARLTQDARLCVEALVTLGRLDPAASPRWDGGVEDVPTPAPADCVPLVPDGRFDVPLLEQEELRLDPATLGWTRGDPSGSGELRGWIDLPEDGAFDPVSLLFAVDATPPPTFEVALSGWVPTLQLSAYVRALPAPGPVRIRHRAHLISQDRVDESCQVWDSTGALVAQATQLAGVRLR